ncbi:Carbohydrate binding domain-containing protein [Parapedobacter luteus]|uniref:Beta-xylanase n=1 Tax=Parapedobacter luteus TaxID=623280 RepID=A0A1T5BEY9_9SPHI|nr:endo-1,4-beta-xylanase [Parapedobacter luteus]SKB45589.1 Carbohydrate binding domain-containing protein [Parapedobacter luteus]
MNQLCKMGLPAIALFMAAACNEYEPLAFHAVKPESVVLQEDIDSYDALKSYIDRSVHNQFKLGGATSLSSYVQKGVMYRLMNRNFDEITLGYAMKHGAVVQADGSLALSDVAGFLAMANAAGLSVYGHTLCWHVNQNAAYLNKLIEPTVIPGTDEAGGGGDAGYAYTFTNQSAVNFWEAQVAYDLPNLENNQEYVLKFAVKATEAGTIRAEVQSTSDYSSNSFGTFAVSPAWHEYEFTTTTTKGDRNRLVISFGDYVGTVYIDNVSLTVKNSASNLIANGDFESGTDQGWAGWGNGSTRGVSAYGEGFGGVGDQIIEKTPEEKNEILTTALETWIAGMMEVAKDHVHAWDVVNEPMSDWPDPYQLKTGVGKTDMASDEFYWQDYLGADYAVVAFKLAEQYGKPGDLLFINDYGLESSLDKCKGLIEYAKYIESQGARVDGIGTQMHISTSNDKERIAEMFELLAATGKLIKISELDIGVGVPTAQATEQDYQAQAEMYRYVVEKYFELIPPAQRYGITVWSPLDSPQGSSWRAGEPIGLWTEGYVRKPAYAAFAEALTGQ